jgi:solute carrier family 39 (zinc transporter), member 1/2/3
MRAGIFLMLAFTHLIPHSLHTLEAADINPTLAFQATVVGYLVIFAIEKVLFDSHSIIHDAMDTSTPISRPSITLDRDLKRESKGVMSSGKGTEESETDSYSPRSSTSASDRDSDRDSDSEDVLSPRRPAVTAERPRASSLVSQQSAVVLLLAMAVHSLFETVALGMAPDSTSAVIMATSVALHQPAESLSLLVAFLKTSMERKVIMRCAFTSLICPPISPSSVFCLLAIFCPSVFLFVCSLLSLFYVSV